jgi:nucleolin
MHLHELDGRALEVRLDRPPEPKAADTIFVGNLSWDTTQEMLREAFVHIGAPIVSVSVPVNESGRSKGWGLVQFQSLPDAQRALATLDGAIIAGRPMRLRFDKK